MTDQIKQISSLQPYITLTGDMKTDDYFLYMAELDQTLTRNFTIIANSEIEKNKNLKFSVEEKVFVADSSTRYILVEKNTEIVLPKVLKYSPVLGSDTLARATQIAGRVFMTGLTALVLLSSIFSLNVDLHAFKLFQIVEILGKFTYLPVIVGKILTEMLN